MALLVGMTAVSTARAELADGLVSSWPFDGDLLEATATGAHGTWIPGTGDPAERYAAGQFGQGIDLNNFDAGAFDQYVEIAGVDESAFDFADGSMSVSAWVSTPLLTIDDQTVVAKGEGASWRLARNGAGLSVAFRGGGGAAVDDPANDLFLDAAMHHLVGVIEGGVSIRLFIDGQLAAAQDGAVRLGDSTFPLAIGANPAAAGQFFRAWEGVIDDVAVWSRPLTAAEVSVIYSGGAGVAVGDILAGTDSDGDGMPDYYENHHGLNANVDDAADDLDGDGRSNREEFEDGTDPNNPDTDGDGLSDGEEAAAGTSPTSADTDGDLLGDAEEVRGTRNPFLSHVLREPFDPESDPPGDPTDPTSPDSDGDGFDDQSEIRFRSDPNDAADVLSPWQVGLKGYWKLQTDAWTASSTTPSMRVFAESSGQGPAGKLAGTNTTSVASFAGPFGANVARLDGVNQRIEIQGDPEAFDFAGSDFTVSAWFMAPRWTRSRQTLVAKGEGDAWRLARHESNPVLAFAGGAPEIAGGPEVADFTWHHVAGVTRRGNEKALYIDGELVAEGKRSPIAAGAKALMIGGNPDVPNENFRAFFGALTEVAVWSRALTLVEVRTIFNRYDPVDGGGASLDDLITGTDTDGDGMPDLFETAFGLDPNAADGDGDLDGDGVSNRDEHDNRTDPGEADTDGDGLNDGEEAARGTDPLDADTDGDGLSDGDEVAGTFGAPSDPNDPRDPPAPSLEPALVGHWTFEAGEELTDRKGNFADLILEGDAQVADGSLDLNGLGTSVTGWAHASALPTSPPLAAKTFAVWVTMQGLEEVAKAGAPLSIDVQSGDRFDGIVFAERSLNRWMNGSSGFQRSPPEQFVGPSAVESVVGEPLHLAITYEDLGNGDVQITGYRNGVPMASYTSGAFATWASGEYEALFGPRHTNPGTNGAIDALVHDARIYNRAATALQVEDLYNEGLGAGPSLDLTDIRRETAGGEVMVTIEWVSRIGATYRLEWSPDLGRTVPPGWIEELDGYPAGGATSDRTSYAFAGIPPGAARRFFRVVEEE